MVSYSQTKPRRVFGDNPKGENTMNIKHIIRVILDCFFDTVECEYFEWTWDSPEERDAFRKYFRFCN